MPNPASIVVFSNAGATNLGTTLGNASYSVLGIRTDSATVADTSIGSTGGSLTVGGGGISVDTAETFTIAAPLLTSTTTYLLGGSSAAGTLALTGSLGTGVAGLIKSGPGLLTLPSAYGYTGPTVINGGSLQVGTGGTTGSLSTSSGISIGSGADLAFNRSNAAVQGSEFSSAPITGAGGLTKLGSGTLSLTASNSYTGPTVIAAGTLQFIDDNTGRGGAISTGSSISIATGAVLAINRVGIVTQGLEFPSSVSGTGGLTKLGTGLLRITSANSYSGPTAITAGTLQLGVGGTAGSLSPSSAISVGSGAAFTVNRSDAVVQGTDFSGAGITGAGSFVKSGSGNVSLSASNSFAGSLTVNGGTLSLTGGTVTPTQCNINASFVQSAGRNLAVNLIVAQQAASSGSYALANGLLQVTGQSSVGVLGVGTFAQTGGTHTVTAGGVLSVGVLNTGVGVYSLSGGTLSTYKTTVGESGNGVFIQIGGTHAASSLQLGIASSGTGSYTFSGGSPTVDGIFRGSGRASFDMDGGRLVASGTTDGLFSNFSPTVNAGGAIIDSQGFNVTLNSALAHNPAPGVAGDGGLTKPGSGILVLAAANTYVGPTAVTAGTLRIGTGGASGSVLGDIVNNASLVLNRSDSFSLPGLITGTGVISKLGAGTFMFSAGKTAPYMAAALTISGGSVDLTDNDMILSATTETAVRGMVSNWYDGGPHDTGRGSSRRWRWRVLERARSRCWA